MEDQMEIGQMLIKFTKSAIHVHLIDHNQKIDGGIVNEQEMN